MQFFRQASPYIEGHRGRTFVLAIPGEVVDQKSVLHALLEDVALLHGGWGSGAGPSCTLYASGLAGGLLLPNLHPPPPSALLPRPPAGLGVKVVLVVGARLQVNEAIRATGSEPQFVSGYRVTDAVAMEAAVQAAGAARMEVEARLSKVWGRGGAC